MVKILRSKVRGIYVDTNFILDCTEGRNDKSIALILKIKEKGWRCVTSAFTIMEIADIKKDEAFIWKKLQKKWELKKILRERYKKDLNNDDFEEISNYLQNKILNAYPYIETINLTPEGWALALQISRESNVATGDAIHLASTWSSQCNYLITSDGPFIKNAETVLKKLDFKGISIMTPDKFLEIYEE